MPVGRFKFNNITIIETFNNMTSKYFDQVKVSELSKRYIDKSFAISDRIITLLERKQMTQRQLAEKMGKRESEISKWLTGTHNFTLKTIAKLEEILEEDIVLVSVESTDEVMSF